MFFIGEKYAVVVRETPGGIYTVQLKTVQTTEVWYQKVPFVRIAHSIALRLDTVTSPGPMAAHFSSWEASSSVMVIVRWLI